MYNLEIALGNFKIRKRHANLEDGIERCCGRHMTPYL